MKLARREFVAAGAVALVAIKAAEGAAATVSEPYGLIGQIKAAPGQREMLIGYLRQGSGAMPGNLAYLIARDAADPDAIWITEVWESREAHQNSLTLPAVQEAIRKARPIVAGFGQRIETVPVLTENR